MTEARAHDSVNQSPFDAWRHLYEENESAWTKAMKEFYEANEQIWTKAMKDVTTTQWFAEAQGKMLESFLAFQKMLRDSTTAQLNNLNIATRDDVSRLGELIIGLEEKIDTLDDRLASVEVSSGSFQGQLGGFEAKLASLGSTSSAVEPKIDSLDGRISGLVDKVGKFDSRLANLEQRIVTMVGRHESRHSSSEAAAPIKQTSESHKPSKKRGE